MPLYFLVARLLSMKYLESGKEDDGARRDLDMVMQVFDRIAERYPGLVSRYRGFVRVGLGKVPGRTLAGPLLGGERSDDEMGG